MWQGREVLGMRVTWDKRYITLAPVCTLLGLAFRLYDPDGLLGDKKDIGITCALVPYDHPGVDIGRRHLPLNAVFVNGPTRGKDVFMPLDFIIGGPAMAGQGWRMLMECLAAGRSISLPASNTGMAKMTARAVGAYARVRSQFNLAIGRFEGIEEPLTRIGAYTYLMDAARVMTAGAIDLGEKPSVVSAIAKYHVTERARQVVNRRHGHHRRQGHLPRPIELPRPRLPADADRHHRRRRQHPDAQPDHLRPGRHPLPSLRAEGNAAAHEPDASKGLVDFDAALFGHIGFTIGNGLRALLAWPDRLAHRVGARRGAGNAPLLPAADALLGRLRLSRRHLHAGHGRRPQAQGKAVGAPRRHPGPDVPDLGHAQALRSRRPPGRPTRR